MAFLHDFLTGKLGTQKSETSPADAGHFILEYIIIFKYSIGYIYLDIIKKRC